MICQRLQNERMEIVPLGWLSEMDDPSKLKIQWNPHIMKIGYLKLEVRSEVVPQYELTNGKLNEVLEDVKATKQMLIVKKSVKYFEA